MKKDKLGNDNTVVALVPLTSKSENTIVSKNILEEDTDNNKNDDGGSVDYPSSHPSSYTVDTNLL
jgi:hypothetical protein